MIIADRGSPCVEERARERGRERYVSRRMGVVADVSKKKNERREEGDRGERRERGERE